MNTKHFKDKDNNLFGITIHAENAETWQSEIQEDWTEITIEEAQVIANPPPTQDELDAQKEAANIAFLASESERTEDEIKIYERMRDRNRADADDLAMLELLEDYSIDLKKVTKQKEWPLDVDWPVAPEF